MIKKKFFFILFFYFKIILSQTFSISGKITNHKENLPYAIIHLKGSVKGVNSNDEGNYILKLEKGKHTLSFQYVGYSKQEFEINLEENKILNVELKSDGIGLQEVVINAGEDPAYPIMRKAIKKRKFFFNQVNEFSCQSYIKGLQRLMNVPEKFKKLIKITTGEKIDSTKLGVIYLSESESNYYFKKPDKEKEVMFSSKVSGENKNFSFNQLSQLKFNFYDNLIKIKGLSDRPIISPLNRNAFLYYKYILLGIIKEEGSTFYKIKITPKRKTDPCFSGIIYIQDKYFRLSSVDLKLTKENKINYVDTLRIKQIQMPIIGDSVWMPINHNLSFYFSFLGIKGSGYFNAIIKNYNLNPGFNSKTFNDEVLVIEDGANKKDTGYWDLKRPSPLTAEEKIDYRKKDSVEKIEETVRYKDSTDHIKNKFRLPNLFLGYIHKNTLKGITILLPSIINNGVHYNTVEGLNLSSKFSIKKEFEDLKFHLINGRIRYGFSNNLWGFELDYNYSYNPKKNSRFGMKIKSIVEQYNQLEPISPLVNTLYTLLNNENYLKVYKESGVEVNYNNEIINGIFFNSLVKYVQRDPLKNSSDQLIIDDKTKLFTGNDPINPNSNKFAFESNRALVAEIKFLFRIRQKFITTPNRKILLKSNYPKINIIYKKAFPIINTSADFDLASCVIYDEINLGILGRMAYRIKGGRFLNDKKLLFIDYNYFMGNQTIFSSMDYLNCFRLLPYYLYSSNLWHTEAHAEHHFNGFIVNKIPVLKKFRIQEVLGLHLLMANTLKEYYEISFGIENIFNVIRFDYLLNYGINNKINYGFTLGINTRL